MKKLFEGYKIFVESFECDKNLKKGTSVVYEVSFLIISLSVLIQETVTFPFHSARYKWLLAAPFTIPCPFCMYSSGQ